MTFCRRDDDEERVNQRAVLERPSTRYDPNEDVRSRMIRFIKNHYVTLLGKDAKLLDEQGGLDRLAKKYCL